MVVDLPVDQDVLTRKNTKVTKNLGRNLTAKNAENTKTIFLENFAHFEFFAVK
jgi:hypothetical protein